MRPIRARFFSRAGTTPTWRNPRRREAPAGVLTTRPFVWLALRSLGVVGRVGETGEVTRPPSRSFSDTEEHRRDAYDTLGAVFGNVQYRNRRGRRVRSMSSSVRRSWRPWPVICRLRPIATVLESSNGGSLLRHERRRVQSIIGVSPVSGWMTPQASREPTPEDVRPASHSREGRVALPSNNFPKSPPKNPSENARS